jgi:uncharacterized protein YlxW (UPF0749 family)
MQFFTAEVPCNVAPRIRTVQAQNEKIAELHKTVVQLQKIVDTRHSEMRDAHARDVKAINKVQYHGQGLCVTETAGRSPMNEWRGGNGGPMNA